MFDQVSLQRPPRAMIVGLFLTALLCILGVTMFSSSFAEVDAQITPIDDEPESEPPGLGNIVGSPEAGPDPEDAGDRGGWAQLGLAIVLLCGVAFIASRIVRDSRRSRASNVSPNETL